MPNDKLPSSPDHPTTCVHPFDGSAQAATDRRIDEVELKSDRLLARGGRELRLRYTADIVRRLLSSVTDEPGGE